MNKRKLEILAEKSQYLAESFRDKMKELQVGKCLDITFAEYKTNVGYHEVLSQGDSGNLLLGTIGDPGNSFYVHSDFNCMDSHPTIDEALNFLESAEVLREELEKIEAQISERIDSAIS